MVANPMQRKARNSFLLGMLISILVMGAIVAVLLLQLQKLKEAENARQASLKNAYVISADVKSGESLTAASVKKVEIASDGVPSDAITTSSLTDTTVAKIDLKKGTVLTSAMISESNEKTTSDLRVQEYNMIKLSSQIKTGDCIDIRLRMPSGLDYIVVSKKTVEVPQIAGVDSENTIWVKLTEDETLVMSEAIVEAYTMTGSVLYTANYVEPGMQEAATPTYVPSGNVQNLIHDEPNIVTEAKNALINRYNSASSVRNHIDGEKSAYSEDASKNVEKGVSTETSTAQGQRKAYLDALSGK